MKRLWLESMMIGMALFLMPMRVSGQPNLISARPGCLNYFEGDAFLNAQPLTGAMIGKTFIKAGDKMSTGKGKTELLLTPGVFLRIDNDSQVQVTSLSLIDIQLELLRGEAMIEADEMTKDNRIAIRVRNASALIEKPGLYRFAIGQESSVAVISGKVHVSADGRDVTFGRGHQVSIADSLEKQSFDPKKEDDLYAWSNERSEYNAAASYQSAQTLSNANYGNGYGAGGSSQNTPGWLWNDSFDSWAWIPGGDMAFFSPFGYGFFSPGAVGYAPLCYARTNGERWRGSWHGRGNWAPVAVDPKHPPATGATPRSAWQGHLASAATSRSLVNSGFRTPAGGYIPAGTRITSSSPAGHLWTRGNDAHVFAGNGGHIGGWAKTATTGGGMAAGGSSHFSGGGARASSGGGAHSSGGGAHGGGGGGHR